MNDENPYAPPLAEDPEAPASRAWSIDGNSVLVKNQAALPPVDLNTGEHDVPLECVRRTLLKSNPLIFVRTMVLLLAFMILTHLKMVDPVLLVICLFVAILIFKQMDATRGSPSRTLQVMEYLGPASLRRRSRGKWRMWANLAVPPTLVLSFFSAVPTGEVNTVLLIAYGLLLGNLAWGLFDRPPARSQVGPPGWMKISPVHPEAIRFLSRQRDEMPVTHPGNSGRRKTRTTYFYKFPLAMLIGNKRNPLLILNIALAKLLRSHLFTRDTFHFSEAVPVAPAGLCKPLQEDIASWKSAHPDWVLRSADRLVFPDGDIVVETVHLAPATFEHDLWITCSWHVTTAARLNINHTFVTWLENGGRVSTHDHAFIALEIPGSHVFRARGDLEQIYQAHLRNAAGKPSDPPHDDADRAARVSALLEQIDRRLTDLGYQSELR